MRPVGRRDHCVFLAKDKEGREKENPADRLSKQLAITTLRVVSYTVCSALDTFFSAGTRTIFLNSLLLQLELGRVYKTGKANFGSMQPLHPTARYLMKDKDTSSSLIFFLSGSCFQFDCFFQSDGNKMKLRNSQVVLDREARQEHCPEEMRWEVPWNREMKKRSFA